MQGLYKYRNQLWDEAWLAFDTQLNRKLSVHIWDQIRNPFNTLQNSDLMDQLDDDHNDSV